MLVTTCQLGLVAWYAPTTLEGASLPLLEEEFHTKVTWETCYIITRAGNEPS